MLQENSTISLTNLPNDTLVAIFHFLELKNLQKIPVLCKQFNKLIKDNPQIVKKTFEHELVKYHFEVFKNQIARLKTKDKKRKFLIEEINETEKPELAIKAIIQNLNVNTINPTLRYVSTIKKANADQNLLANSEIIRLPASSVYGASMCFAFLTCVSSLIAVIGACLFALYNDNQIDVATIVCITISAIFAIGCMLGTLITGIKIYKDNQFKVSNEEINKLDDQSPLLIKDDVQNSASSFGSNV